MGGQIEQASYALVFEILDALEFLFGILEVYSGTNREVWGGFQRKRTYKNMGETN